MKLLITERDKMTTEKAIEILDTLIDMVQTTRYELVQIGFIRDEGSGLT